MLPRLPLVLATSLMLTACMPALGSTVPTAQPLPLVPASAQSATTTAVAPDVRDRAAQALDDRPLAGKPAIPVSMKTDRAVSKATRTSMNRAVRTVLRLEDGHRLSSVQVYAGSPDWVHAQVMADPRIIPGEKQAFDERYRAGEMSGGWAYSLRGPNAEQTVGLSLGKASRRDWVRMAARELSVNVYSSWGGSSADRWPCWAGEGLGYPLAFEATARVLKKDYASMRDADVNQLREVDWTVWAPGLQASEAWEGTPQRPCMANPGIGHLQGAVAAEYLIAEFGIEKVMDWAQASYGRSWRAAFSETFGMTVPQFYSAVDAETQLTQ